MLLILLVAIFVLGVAFYQAVQGLFTAIIMALLTVCCAVLAFNFYEPFAEAVLYSSKPAYADAISLISLFVVPLLALRLIFDKFIGGNVLTGMWTDRIAGGCVGLVTALVTTGVLMVAVQMLPIGPSILGYVPFNDKLQRQSSLFPYPDDFTVGLVDTLSGGKKDGDPTGSLATDPASPFSYVHDNLLLELYCARNTGKTDQGESLAGSLEVLPGGLTVLGAFLPGNAPWTTDVPLYPLSPETASTKVVVVRIQLNDESRAKDDDRYYRLVGSQFRLVTASGKSYYPVGHLTCLPEPDAEKRKEKPWVLHAPNENGVALPGKVVVVRPGDQIKMIHVDWVYRIPTEDVLSYMVFRKVARQEIALPKEGMPEPKFALNRK
jgi:uncharacterized membrane protein required for colicin V production